MLDFTAARFVSMGCAALALTGCLTPPCNCAPATGATAAGEVSAASDAPAADPGAQPAAPTAKAGDQVVYDGDEAGLAAKGWADCDKKPDCKSQLAPAPGAGRNNSVGLKFHGEGSGWIGAGWNLFGWWPADAGLDVSGTTHLVMWVKVEAKSKEQAPDATALLTTLKCSTNDKCISKEAVLSKYSKGDLFDGQWHEVAVPLADIKKPEFVPEKVWEVGLSTWQATPKNFNVYVDDISFQKR